VTNLKGDRHLQYRKAPPIKRLPQRGAIGGGALGQPIAPVKVASRRMFCKNSIRLFSYNTNKYGSALR
jgi:hypothetical protein